MLTDIKQNKTKRKEKTQSIAPDIKLNQYNKNPQIFNKN